MQLDRLFRPFETLQLPDGSEVRVRALGDLEMTQRERHAVKSASRRELLYRDPGSAEHAELVADLNAMPDAPLKDMLTRHYKELVAEREAALEIRPRFAQAPDNPSLEEKTAAEQEQDAIDRAVRAEREELAKAKTDGYRASLDALDRASLLSEAEARLILVESNAEYWRQQFYDGLRMAVEIDGRKLFATTADVMNANPALLTVLGEAFSRVNEVDIWELTKEALQGNSTASRPSA